MTSTLLKLCLKLIPTEKLEFHKNVSDLLENEQITTETTPQPSSSTSSSSSSKSIGHLENSLFKDYMNNNLGSDAPFDELETYINTKVSEVSTLMNKSQT